MIYYWLLNAQVSREKQVVLEKNRIPFRFDDAGRLVFRSKRERDQAKKVLGMKEVVNAQNHL